MLCGCPHHGRHGLAARAHDAHAGRRSAEAALKKEPGIKRMYRSGEAQLCMVGHAFETMSSLKLASATEACCFIMSIASFMPGWFILLSSIPILYGGGIKG